MTYTNLFSIQYQVVYMSMKFCIICGPFSLCRVQTSYFLMLRRWLKSHTLCRWISSFVFILLCFSITRYAPLAHSFLNSFPPWFSRPSAPVDSTFLCLTWPFIISAVYSERLRLSFVCSLLHRIIFILRVNVSAAIWIRCVFFFF